MLKQKSIDNQWSNKKEENFHVQRYFHQESISFMCTEDDHRYNSLDDLPLSTSAWEDEVRQEAGGIPDEARQEVGDTYAKLRYWKV